MGAAAKNCGASSPMNAHPASLRPVVLVPACNRLLGHHVFHVAGKKYVDAVRLAGCLPLVVPFVQASEVDELLEHADGVLLTGSPSNVHPSFFGEEVHDTTLPLDRTRDDWTLPLIPRALARGIPLFAICRGFQEANVALGGSLHQAVQELPEHRDHRSNDDDPVDVQYGLAHDVNVQPGGLLDKLIGEPRFRVNSLHGQGVKDLAPGLRVEARSSEDDLVEAFTQPDASAFNLCVQWHPEWQAERNPVSLKLFAAFGDACRAHQQRRSAPQHEPER
jgi:putative glutamine amidotransferase